MTTVPNSTLEDAIYTWVSGASGVSVIWEGQDAPRPAAPYISMLLHVEPVGQDWAGQAENPLTFADKPVMFDNLTDQVLATAHALQTGDGPVRLTVAGGALPAELATGTDYWWIRDDANKGGLATSLVAANAGTRAAFTDDGTGTTKLIATADTRTRGAEILSYARGNRRCRLVLSCFGGVATGANAAAGILNAVAAAANLPTRRAALRAADVGLPTFGPAQVAGASLNSAHFEPRAVMEAVFFTGSEVSETNTYIETVEITEQVADDAGDPLGDVTVDVSLV